MALPLSKVSKRWPTVFLLSLQAIKHVAVAIACPIFGDVVSMTNCHWRFSISELQKKLALKAFKVVNDFSAIALSLPVLAAQELMQIGKGTADIHKTRVVLGAGTGLGVSYLIANQHGYQAYAGEGGHADWSVTNEQEWFIYSYLKRIYAHVSYERILSGQGFEHLYQALAAFQQQTVRSIKTAEIISLALTQKCTIAQAAVMQFFASLGAYAGDLALTFGAFGGVYLAGGIVPRLLTLLPQSAFRSSFEEKGRFKEFNTQIPTYIITAPQPGILGAAVYLKHSLIGELDVVS